MSQEKELGSNIEAGSTKSFEIDDTDVGDINKLLIKVTGTKGYRCKEVRIKKKGDSNIVFQCLKTLKPCHPGGSQFFCQDELLPQGGSSYEITLKTSGEPESGTTSPILVGIIGEKGISNYQMLSETGASINSKITNVIKIKDVGKISGYQIKLAESGKWKGAHMIIKNIKTGQVSQFDLKDVIIENPGKDFYKYDSSAGQISVDASLEIKTASQGTMAFSAGGFAKVFSMATDIFGENESDKQQEEDDDGLTELIQEVSESVSFSSTEGSLDTGVSSGNNPNDPDGGLLDQSEKKSNNL